MNHKNIMVSFYIISMTPMNMKKILISQSNIILAFIWSIDYISKICICCDKLFPQNHFEFFSLECYDSIIAQVLYLFYFFLQKNLRNHSMKYSSMCHASYNLKGLCLLKPHSIHANPLPTEPEMAFS